MRTCFLVHHHNRSLTSTTYSAYYETMRLVPPVTNVPKVSARDTTLTIHDARGEKVVIPVQAGTQVAMDIAGLHHNRQSPLRFVGTVLTVI